MALLAKVALPGKMSHFNQGSLHKLALQLPFTSPIQKVQLLHILEIRLQMMILQFKMAMH